MSWMLQRSCNLTSPFTLMFSHSSVLRSTFWSLLAMDNLVFIIVISHDFKKIFYQLLFRLIWSTDLSFNNIEVIEGLDQLTKLEDLTLFNNRIQRLENMDTLSELHVFSVGNNELKELTNVRSVDIFVHHSAVKHSLCLYASCLLMEFYVNI